MSLKDYSLLIEFIKTTVPLSAINSKLFNWKKSLFYFFLFQARQDFWRRHQRHLSGGGHAGGAREPLHRAAQGL